MNCCHAITDDKVSASGKAILITGCESPLAWCLARKLDELGFTIFAGFTKRSGCADADLLKEESSGRTKILQLDVTSETQVNTICILLWIICNAVCECVSACVYIGVSILEFFAIIQIVLAHIEKFFCARWISQTSPDTFDTFFK